MVINFFDLVMYLVFVKSYTVGNLSLRAFFEECIEINYGLQQIVKYRDIKVNLLETLILRIKQLIKQATHCYLDNRVSKARHETELHCVIFFTVVESHPDNMLEDLRLDKPFPELREHVQSYDLDRMDKKVSMCLPYVF